MMCTCYGIQNHIVTCVRNKKQQKIPRLYHRSHHWWLSCKTNISSYKPTPSVIAGRYLALKTNTCIAGQENEEEKMDSLNDNHNSDNNVNGGDDGDIDIYNENDSKMIDTDDGKAKTDASNKDNVADKVEMEDNDDNDDDDDDDDDDDNDNFDDDDDDNDDNDDIKDGSDNKNKIGLCGHCGDIGPFLVFCSACGSDSGMLYDVMVNSDDEFSLMEEEHQGEFELGECPCCHTVGEQGGLCGDCGSDSGMIFM